MFHRQTHHPPTQPPKPLPNPPTPHHPPTPQVQQTITVQPDRIQAPISSTAVAYVRVSGCEKAPNLVFLNTRASAVRAYSWRVSKKATSPTSLTTPWTNAVSIDYEVAFDRVLLGVGNFKIETELSVENVNYFDLVLGFIQVEARLPGRFLALRS